MTNLKTRLMSTACLDCSAEADWKDDDDDLNVEDLTDEELKEWRAHELEEVDEIDEELKTRT